MLHLIIEQHQVIKEDEMTIERFMSKVVDFSVNAVSGIKLFLSKLLMDFADTIPGTKKDGGKQ